MKKDALYYGGLFAWSLFGLFVAVVVGVFAAHVLSRLTMGWGGFAP